jgi:hypothetical protein
MGESTSSRGYSFSKEIDEQLQQLLFAPTAPIEKSLDAPTRRFEAASELYLAGYRNLSLRKALSTHELITQAGQRLAGPAHGPPARDVVSASTGPDEQRAGWRLFFEGHFYGPTPEGGLGNYMSWVFAKPLRSLMAGIDDIEEHAHGNFLRQARLAAQSPTEATPHGWALHYLQDLTAPHHVRNFPIFLPRPGYALDTHHAFEKRANGRFSDVPDRYDVPAKTPLAALRMKGFDLRSEAGREAFVDWVHEAALTIADGDWIHAGESTAWDPKIDAALALAVAATAYFVERIAT